MNDVAESLTGWRTDEAIGHSLDAVFRIVNEETRQPVASPATRAMAEGDVFGLANRTVLIRKNGTELPIDDSAAPIRCQEGEIVGCVLVFRDVTERRRLEKENASRLVAARLLASIVESSEDAIVSKSLDGIIQTWNAAAERIFGYLAEEVIGRHINILIPSDRQDEEEMIISRIRAGERVEHFDTVRRRKDGQHIPVSLTISPVKDDKGKVIGASKIARDITDRKQAEIALRQLAADLSESNRRKEEFLATLVHELRGPLAPLRNALTMMKVSDDNRAALEDTREMMERQLNQMVRLVDDLMDLNRINRGKLELRKERVELASIVHQAVETIRPMAACVNHEIDVTLPTKPIYLDADIVRLTQVLINLLNNSCKYCEPGGKISLTAEGQGSDVVLSVKDNGIGIPSDKLESIFEMFSQVDSTLERSQGGLGIGLTLVRRLVELHGGSITAHSEGAGRGSEFIIRLPHIVEAGTTQPVKNVPQEKRPTSRCRILVVDDNRDSADSLAMLLQITGNDSHTAHDGEQAVARAAELRPDVILLDIGMPKLNGYEACRRIREQPWGREPILIALTGWGQEDDKRQSREAGFNGHLVKPVDLNALIKLLVELKPVKP
jgi:PAS domain S-box-containing protein